MRIYALPACAAATMCVLGSVAPPVYAAPPFGVEINGVYHMRSDGEFAKTNDVYIDEQTVDETWTMSSTCSTPIDCHGTVHSDRGWTAEMYYTYPNNYWVADHIVPKWVPCPDGTFADGHQFFSFWGINPATSDRNMKNTTQMVGRNRTLGPSGACGVSKQVVIELPLELVKLS